MSDQVEGPTTETLRVAFGPSAWWRNSRGSVGVVIVVALYYLWLWMGSDAVARSFLDVWGFPLVLGVAIVIRLVAARLRRDPHLRIDQHHVEATYTQSYTRRVDRSRVTEIRFNPKRKTIRFEIPDGLVLTVDATALDLTSVAENAEAFAELCARTLDVPLVRV